MKDNYNIEVCDSVQDPSLWDVYLNGNLERHYSKALFPTKMDVHADMSSRLVLSDNLEDIHSPDHYTHGSIEVLDVIKAKLTPEQYKGYLMGNMTKYLLRANFKGEGDKDLMKCAYYAEELRRLVANEEYDEKGL